MDWRNSAESSPADDPCLKRINVLAHSMGNRVLRQTMVNWQKDYQPAGVPLLFRNTFLVAADIVNESLHRGQPGELLSHASRNVVVYYASDDLALRASKVSNLKNAEASRRLGHSDPEDMDLTPKNVYAIDCDDVNTAKSAMMSRALYTSTSQKSFSVLLVIFPCSRTWAMTCRSVSATVRRLYATADPRARWPAALRRASGTRATMHTGSSGRCSKSAIRLATGTHCSPKCAPRESAFNGSRLPSSPEPRIRYQ